MRNSYSVVFIVFILCVSGSRAGARTDDAKRCARHVLPANVDLPGDLAKVLEQLYDSSSTFRIQCARVGEAPNVRVSVQLDTSIRSSCRAFTEVRRRGWMIRAHVHLPPSGTQLAELVGHEFEHILEQVEGLNLRALADMKGSGVHEVEHDLYETDRAQRTGRIVAAEVRATRSARRNAD